MDTSAVFSSVADVVAWLRRSPTGTLVDARVLAETLAPLVDVQPEPVKLLAPPELTWRERLWLVPAETRLGVAEVAEALARPKSYVYGRTGPSADDPIPHRKLDGLVLFAAGEVRAWLRSRETVVHAGPMESVPAERVLRSVP